MCIRDRVTPRVTVEDRVVKATIPERSVFKEHEPFLVQAPRLRRGKPGDFGKRDLLPLRTLGHTGWTHDPGTVARGDRWSFRSRTPPLRADALSSGSVDPAPVGDAVVIVGCVDLETSGATVVDGKAR